jgi:hypothetical protein
MYIKTLHIPVGAVAVLKDVSSLCFGKQKGFKIINCFMYVHTYVHWSKLSLEKSDRSGPSSGLKHVQIKCERNLGALHMYMCSYWWM